MRITMRYAGLAFAAVLPCASVSAQLADKPSIMVMPSEMFMKERGYCTPVTIDGRPANDCDYTKMLTSDKDFAAVVANVSIAFQERGFPIQQLEATLKQIAEDAALTLASSKAIRQTATDMILQTAKPDIAVELKIEVSSQMGQQKLNMILDAIDVYTSTSVATANQSSMPSASLTQSELAKAIVVTVMPSIEGKLMDHFRRMASEGRQVRLRVDLTEKAGLDDGVNTEVSVGGEDIDLATYISRWARKFAVGGQVRPGRNTESSVTFSSMNIPFTADPLEVRSAMRLQFRKDTGLNLKVGVGRGPGDFIFVIDEPAKGAKKP